MIKPADLDEIVPLSNSAQTILENALSQGRLSARGVGRVRTVSRTIADLEASGNGPGDAATDEVTVEQLCLAMSLRVDPFGFGQ